MKISCCWTLVEASKLTNDDLLKIWVSLTLLSCSNIVEGSVLHVLFDVFLCDDMPSYGSVGQEMSYDVVDHFVLS